jgi:hypothetical protein
MTTALRKPVTDPAPPDWSKPYVALNANGAWGSKRYYLVRWVRPGVADFVDDHGALCEEVSIVRMKLIAFAEDAPTPEQQVAKEENRRYRNRSRVSAPARQKKPASAKQLGLIGGLQRTLGLSKERLLTMTPRRSLDDLAMWEASRLIDRLKEV